MIQPWTAGSAFMSERCGALHGVAISAHLQLISTCELLFTLVVSTDSGPVRKSSSSFFSSSSTLGCLISDMSASRLHRC